MKKIISVLLMLLMVVCVLAQSPERPNRDKKEPPREHIYLNRHRVVMRPGEYIQLEADTFGYVGRISWRSSNSRVAYVDRGRVYAMDYGSCNIIASIPGASDYCEIIVTNDRGGYNYDYKLSLNETKVVLNKGETFHLQLYVNGFAEDDDIIYTTKNTRVATIDGDGVITARGIGTTTILVKYGNREVSCNVRVIMNRH